MSRVAMSMKVTPHVQTAGKRLHVPIQHRTRPVTAWMPQRLKETSSATVEFLSRFKRFTLQLLPGKGDERTPIL